MSMTDGKFNSSQISTAHFSLASNIDHNVVFRGGEKFNWQVYVLLRSIHWLYTYSLVQSHFTRQFSNYGEGAVETTFYWQNACVCFHSLSLWPSLCSHFYWHANTSTQFIRWAFERYVFVLFHNQIRLKVDKFLDYGAYGCTHTEQNYTKSNNKKRSCTNQAD